MTSTSTGTAASPASSITPNSSTGAYRQLPPRQSWPHLPRSLKLSHGSPVPRALGGPASVHLSCLALLLSLFSTCKPLLVQKTDLKHSLSSGEAPSVGGKPWFCSRRSKRPRGQGRHICALMEVFWNLLCPIREPQVTHVAAEHLKRGLCDRGTFHFASLCFAYV